MTAPNRRHVRVTIEGEAYAPAAGVLMVVRQDGGKVCLPEGPGITVENLEPPRVWTDGDVVQDTCDGETFTRSDGTWRSTHTGCTEAADSTVSRWTSTEDGWLVLRYQHGGDQ